MEILLSFIICPLRSETFFTILSCSRLSVHQCCMLSKQSVSCDQTCCMLQSTKLDLMPSNWESSQQEVPAEVHSSKVCNLLIFSRFHVFYTGQHMGCFFEKFTNSLVTSCTLGGGGRRHLYEVPML